MAGVRKTNPTGIADSDARVAVLLPKEIDRQLRALAARRHSAVAPIIREWIIEKLSEASSDDSPEPASTPVGIGS